MASNDEIVPVDDLPPHGRDGSVRSGHVTQWAEKVLSKAHANPGAWFRVYSTKKRKRSSAGSRQQALKRLAERAGLGEDLKVATRSDRDDTVSVFVRFKATQQ